MKNSILNAAVVGAASYTGGELLKILANHRRAAVRYACSGSLEGRDIGSAHPFLDSVMDIKMAPYEPEKIIENCDIVFLAKPHPSSFGFVKDLLGKGPRIIDLSPGFRFSDPGVFELWYGQKHGCPEYAGKSVYGLPELYAKEIAKGLLVANPGCYPTSIVLGAAPLFKENMVWAHNIFASSVSGFSGAGRSRVNESNFAPDIFNNIRPYKTVGHPHTGEIETELGKICSGEVRVTFVPHVAGFERGILSTICMNLRNGVSKDKLADCYENFYAGKHFIRIRRSGAAQIKDVVNTNFCDIGIALNERTGAVIVNSALDNLVKGASGQAVQNMNIMFGMDEREGMLPV